MTTKCGSERDNLGRGVPAKITLSSVPPEPCDDPKLGPIVG